MSEIDKALQIMEQLRDPDSGCPWDIKQTHSSIAKPLTTFGKTNVKTTFQKNGECAKIMVFIV